MIRTVTLRRFKRFAEQTFTIPGHMVIAGPNDAGKTTLLQAIAAWDLALTRWREQNDFVKHGGAYTKVPVARGAFAAVPLRRFDLLWTDRDGGRGRTIEIAVTADEIPGDGRTITMELIADSSEQIYVRPLAAGTNAAMLRDAALETAFVPPMTGLSTEEPVYQPAKQRQLLGQGKPGEILRNLLVSAHGSGAWEPLRASILRLFGHELLPPNAREAHIVAEYRPKSGGPAFDIAGAGSGFQQVLMLLAFLYTRPASVLLLDEPDAHLHVILQDAIYGELRAVAAEQGSQLIIATHSEVIIDTVEPKDLCLLLDRPRPLADTAERDKLKLALRYLSNTDVMLATMAPGILYTDDYTDVAILRAWARALGHPAHAALADGAFWKPKVVQGPSRNHGIGAQKHFETLLLVRPELVGVELQDRDGDKRDAPERPGGPGRLGLLRWRRYEIENYLLHPAAIERYVQHMLGGAAAAGLALEDVRAYFEAELSGVLKNPFGEHVADEIKASERILPKILAAAGLHGVPKRDFHEIAAVMLPEEIHPEVAEKLDAIAEAFGLKSRPGAAEEARR